MNSREFFARSLELVPGGVHSPVRAFSGLLDTPRFVQRAEGAKFWDVEGREYIDFCMSFGPLILGHQHPEVREEIARALGRGWSYGACEPYSLQLAELLVERLPFIQQVRFLNSGTEAVMTALRLARGVTGRDKIIKFNGHYHGHGDSMLIKGGSGLTMEAEASSLGVSKGVREDTIVLEFGDSQGLQQAFRHYAGQVAGVILEPLPANNGLVLPQEDFLALLRQTTAEHGSLLIFDEVISGFRVAFGGMVEKTGIVPDLVTYGKIIGGGLPVGAVAGPREVMEHLAPMGGVYQAGTLSANPLAMVAGLATLQRLTPQVYQVLQRQTARIAAAFERCSMLCGPLVSYSSLFWIPPESCALPFPQLHRQLLERGIYLAPSACEVAFVGLPHDGVIIAELQQKLWD